MATARTISRFGRTYSEYDPDGASGGPPTWVLASAGAGPGAVSTSSASGIFTPVTAISPLRAGMPVYYKALGVLDFAQAIDATSPATNHPYLVAGLAAADATNGQAVGVLTDGQLSLTDWNNLIGQPLLQPNARYYLSDLTPGALLDHCPTAPGSTVVCIGQAISEQTLEIEINLMVHN